MPNEAASGEAGGPGVERVVVYLTPGQTDQMRGWQIEALKERRTLSASAVVRLAIDELMATRTWSEVRDRLPERRGRRPAPPKQG